MRFMMLIRHGEDVPKEDIPQSLFDAMGKFVEAQTRAGALIDIGRLTPTSLGKRVRLRGGKLSVVDGPFTETKEVVGGYAIIEARSQVHAVEIAAGFMDIFRIHTPDFEGACELRPLDA